MAAPKASLSWETQRRPRSSAPSRPRELLVVGGAGGLRELAVRDERGHDAAELHGRRQRVDLVWEKESGGCVYSTCIPYVHMH
jgi:hypothetical protein